MCKVERVVNLFNGMLILTSVYFCVFKYDSISLECNNITIQGRKKGMRRKTLMRFATIALGFSLLLGGGMDANAKALSKEVTAYGTEEETSVEDQEPALIITTVTEMKRFAANADNYAGKLVQLGCDIKFDGNMDNYTPASEFSGVFDGCGYTISGIDVTDYSGVYTGLFTEITESGVVKNLTIKDCYFSSDTRYIGAVAGLCNGGTITNCHVRNTKVDGKANNAGGIVGGYGYITNCSSAATVTGYYCVGGISGVNGKIENCWNSGTIYVLYDSYSYNQAGNAGGISGYNSSTVQNCYSTGNVSGAYTGTRKYYGGIVGHCDGGKVAKCYCTEDNFVVAEEDNCDVKYCKEYSSLSEMQSTTFLDLLNSNRGDNTHWFLWEIRSGSPYPQHRPLTHVKNCAATLSASTFTYNGNPQTPNVTVKSGNYTLVKDADYKLIYLNNVDAGKATVIVRGMNMFTGDTVLNYSIAKANPKISVKKKFTKAYGTQAFYLNANVTAGESSLSYSSASPKIATVDSSGLVTIKNTGVAQITISIPASKNYNAGTVKTSILVKPKKQTAKLSVKGKKLSITWKKDKRATGYEVQYAFDKKFKKNCKKVNIKKSGTTSYKVKNMKKKKKYYVRVRAYKNVTINGKKQTLYGSWSTVKKISR